MAGEDIDARNIKVNGSAEMADATITNLTAGRNSALNGPLLVVGRAGTTFDGNVFVNQFLRVSEFSVIGTSLLGGSTIVRGQFNMVADDQESSTTRLNGLHGRAQFPSDCIAVRYFARDVEGLRRNGEIQIFNHDESRVIHLGGENGNAQFPNDVVAVRYFGNDVILDGGDCAEEFDILGEEKIEPGTVMVLGQEGALQQSQQAYDKRVAGVVSGAGDLRPGIVLGRRQPQGSRMAIALLGKVYCKADAQYAPIDVGDLLTTSYTPGHAMKAEDASKSFGATVGKALRPLKGGCGLIPILVALQ